MMKSFTFAVLAASATARKVIEYECAWRTESTEAQKSWWQYERPCPEGATTFAEINHEMTELEYAARPALD